MNNNQCCENKVDTGSGFILILVLYVLLAIILGSWISC